MEADNPYNLDMNSTESQSMSDKRASEAVLKKTFTEYMYFPVAAQTPVLRAAAIPELC